MGSSRDTGTRPVAARIADYAMLSDCHSAALVSRDGSIDWWCAPRFDSRSVFGRLLDPEGGHWSIRPAGEFAVEREYVPETMVLRSTFWTEGGTLRLTDALALAPDAHGHELGMECPHALARVAQATRGEVAVAIDYRPRLEYGLITPELTMTDAGIRTVGGPDVLLLATEAPLEVERGRAHAEVMLREGQSLGFWMQHRQGIDRRPPAEAPDARRAIDDAIAAWRSWADLHQSYEGAYREQVERSALVLQALTYQPSGAIIAAATTSLPEAIGGDKNWDYRFAWLRDGSLTARALSLATCSDEAERYFDFMARATVACRSDDHIQIMFGAEGERDLTEHALEHLSGYRGSTPVRVGNNAWRQKQLDVLGEVLDAAYMVRRVLGELEPFTASFLCELAERAAESWRQPDSGIWEGREGERHYITSKVMCWVALDRAIKLADRLGPHARPQRWAAARDEIREAILEQGWDERVGAYTGAFGSDHLDAGVLLMSLYGFVPPSDERMRRTIDTIERELGDSGLVRRWTGAEDEGAFVMCSYWLAECLAMAGELERASQRFESASRYLNDVGLISEEVDTQAGELVGNFPQALSHVALINAASAIEQAARHNRRRSEIAA